MYLDTLQLEKESVHIKLVQKQEREQEGRSELSLGAPKFLPRSPFSIKAKEFVPRKLSGNLWRS